MQLRFWNGFTGPDGRTILRLVQQFNRETPGVGVTLQRMDWATYYNKLFVAGLDGRAPEVFVLQSQWVARMQGAGLTRPTDDLFDDGGGSIPAGDFNDNILAAVTRQGHRWAVPLDVHPMGLYYNKALFRRAGIVNEAGEARPPTNRAEFLDAGRRLGALQADGGGKVWGFAFTWLRTNVFTAMRQFGSPVVDASGSPAPLTDATSVAALEFMHNLIDEGIATPIEANAGLIGFRQGKVGMMFEGIYVLPELQRQTDLDYGAAPTPTMGSQKATWTGSHGLCLRSDLKGLELAAAERFIKFLSDNSLSWAEGGQVPARLSLRETDRFRAMGAQAAFAEQIPYAAYPPQVPWVYEYETEYDRACERALRGEVPAAEALAFARRKMESARDRFIEAGVA